MSHELQLFDLSAGHSWGPYRSSSSRGRRIAASAETEPLTCLSRVDSPLAWEKLELLASPKPALWPLSRQRVMTRTPHSQNASVQMQICQVAACSMREATAFLPQQHARQTST